MTKHRKGLLVVDNDDEIIGIITPKDVLMRVVAQGKSPDVTRGVFSVMTPNPDSVPADLTIWDALKEMHDHRNLPQKFHHVPEAGGPTGNNNALEFDFKVTDQHGNMHKLRFHADCVDTVRNEVAKKLELDLNEFLFKYIDDEKWY